MGYDAKVNKKKPFLRKGKKPMYNTDYSTTKRRLQVCPVCGNTDGSCAEFLDTHIVMCRKVKPETIPDNYRLGRELRGGMGYLAIPMDLKPGEFDRPDYVPPTKLDPDELDRIYKRREQLLPLQPKDRLLLEERGLSLQTITHHKFISNRPKIKADLDSRTPHYDPETKRLKGKSGALILVQSPLGLRRGYIRITSRDDRRRGLPKYLSEKDGARLNGGGQLIHTAIPTPPVSPTGKEPITETVYARLEARDGHWLINLENREGDTVYSSFLVDRFNHIPQLAAIEEAIALGVESLVIPPLNIGTKPFWVRIIETYAKSLKLLKTLPETGKPATTTTPEYRDCYLKKDILLCDSPFKAILACELHHAIVMGCTGMQFTSSSDFYPDLAEISPTKVLSAPDAGDILNVSNIPLAHYRTNQAIEGLGFPHYYLWWGQEEKEKHFDIDELTPEQLKAAKVITPEDYVKLHPIQIQERLDSRNSPGTLYKKSGFYKTIAPVPYPHKIYSSVPDLFKKGERTKKLLGAGKYVLDSSQTGTGKSHDINKMTVPEEFDKVIWCVPNPLTREYPDWYGHRGRDNGRWLEKASNEFKASPGKGREKVLDGNCQNYKGYKKLLNSGVTPDFNNLCKTCPYLDSCEYLSSKQRLVTETRIRMHPSSIYESLFPDSKILLVCDDISDNAFYEKFDLPLEKLIKYYESPDPIRDDFPALQEAFANLLKLVSDTKLTLFPAIQECFAGINFDDPRLQQIIGFDFATIINAEEEEPLYPFFLPKLLQVLSGAGIAISENGKLTLYQKNRKFIDFCKRDNVKVVFLDATQNPQILSRWLEIDILDLDHIEQVEAKGADLEITQIYGLGRLGYNRSQRQVKKLNDLIHLKCPNVPTIDNKKSKVNSKNKLNYFASSRGSNQFQNQHEMVVIGSPSENLVASACKFHLLYNRFPDLEDTDLRAYPVHTVGGDRHYTSVIKESKDRDFAYYYNRNTTIELIQAFGRLRANHRPGEKLHIIYIGDAPLPMPVNPIHYKDWEATGKQPSSPVTFRKIESTTKYLGRDGGNTTQFEVARALGFSSWGFRKHLKKIGITDWVYFKRYCLLKCHD